MTVIVFVLQKYPDKKLSKILIINSSNMENDSAILDIVKKYCKDYKVKSKNITKNSLDMIIEINIADDNKMLQEILAINTITSASILSHDGEITA